MGSAAVKHYYIRVTHPQFGDYWLGFEREQPLLFDKVLYAVALDDEIVENWRRYIMNIMPICRPQLIECDSRKIIPENMRKVLNIA